MWAVGVLKAGGRKVAQENLKAQSFETYSPRLYCSETMREVDLFPGYILIRAIGDMGAAQYTRGIASLVRMGSHLSLVTDTEIDRIRFQEGQDGVIRPPPTYAPPRFRRRQRVRLLPRAHMAGNRGSIVTYLHATAEERCKVLMRLLGRSVPLEVLEGDLVAI